MSTTSTQQNENMAAIGSRPIRAHHSSHVHASFGARKLYKKNFVQETMSDGQVSCTSRLVQVSGLCVTTISLATGWRLSGRKTNTRVLWPVRPSRSAGPQASGPGPVVRWCINNAVQHESSVCGRINCIHTDWSEVWQQRPRNYTRSCHRPPAVGELLRAMLAVCSRIASDARRIYPFPVFAGQECVH